MKVDLGSVKLVKVVHKVDVAFALCLGKLEQKVARLELQLVVEAIELTHETALLVFVRGFVCAVLERLVRRARPFVSTLCVLASRKTLNLVLLLFSAFFAYAQRVVLDRGLTGVGETVV